MNKLTTIAREKKSQSHSNTLSQKQKNNTSATQFLDNRPEALA